MTPQVSSPTPPAAQLSGVQALRGLAACIVVLSHAASHVDKAFGAAWLETVFHPGHAGVDLFFVISGFIILFVHGKDIGRPRRVAHYLSRRFSRVYPLYWTALAITVAIMVAGSHAMPEFRRMVFSIFLMPAPGGQVLGVAWTLECELVFYAVFAVLVLNRSFGRATMAVWLAWIALTGAGYHLLRAPPALNGMYCLEFFFGMAVAQLTRLGPIPQPRLVAATGLALFAAAMWLDGAGILKGLADPGRLAYGGSAAVLMAGVVAAERGGHLVVPRWLQAIGSASYSIYLFQFVFIGIVWQAWLRAGLAQRLPPVACFTVLALAALAGGMLTARMVEQPLLRLLRGRRPAALLQPTA